jgi:AAA domain
MEDELAARGKLIAESDRYTPLPVVESPWPDDDPGPPEPPDVDEGMSATVDTPAVVVPTRNGHQIDGHSVGATKVAAHQRHPVLDWERVFAGAAPDVDWLVPEFIARGQSYSLVSQAKAGKSLLMLDVAAAVACGKSALGQAPLAPARVLYVDLENTLDDLVERLRDMGYRAEDLSQLRYLSFPSLPALDSPAGGAEIAELGEYHDAALVVIDTVARVTVGEENSADTYRHLYRYTLAPLKAQRRAVIRLDHQGKGNTGAARGSSAKNDDVDVVWQLTQKAADDGTIWVGLKLERQRGSSHPDHLYLKRETIPRLHHVTKLPTLDNPERQRVASCIEAMVSIGLPADTGGRKARVALREQKHRFGNDTINAAVRARKALATCPEMVADTHEGLL